MFLKLFGYHQFRKKTYHQNFRIKKKCDPITKRYFVFSPCALEEFNFFVSSVHIKFVKSRCNLGVIFTFQSEKKIRRARKYQHPPLGQNDSWHFFFNSGASVQGRLKASLTFVSLFFKILCNKKKKRNHHQIVKDLCVETNRLKFTCYSENWLI